MTVDLAATLRVPVLWGRLLTLPDLSEAAPQTARCAHGSRECVLDTAPYLEDDREVGLCEGEWRVSLHLCSGLHGYWLCWEVWRGEEPVEEACFERCYELPEGPQEIELADGTVLRLVAVLC